VILATSYLSVAAQSRHYGRQYVTLAAKDFRMTTDATTKQMRDAEPVPDMGRSDNKTGRLNTQLEAQGAEFLVLGHLLIEGIVCHKTYTNIPGYDLIASMPERNSSARIQVKSRWATDFDRAFPIRNFDCDFVVLVALNRGFRSKSRRSDDDPTKGRTAPIIYIFPVDLVRSAQNPNSSWGKASIRNIPSVSTFVDRWDLIRSFLAERSSAPPASSRGERSI
jgi:hypothetical protein